MSSSGRRQLSVCLRKWQLCAEFVSSPSRARLQDLAQMAETKPNRWFTTPLRSKLVFLTSKPGAFTPNHRLWLSLVIHACICHWQPTVPQFENTGYQLHHWLTGHDREKLKMIKEAPESAFCSTQGHVPRHNSVIFVKLK